MKTSRLARGTLYAYGAVVLSFLVLPVIAVIPLSFNAGSFLSYPVSGWSLRWYQNLAGGEAGWIGAFQNSLLVATLATAIATPLGTFAALGLARLNSMFKPLIVAVLLAPMFVPAIIIAVATYFVYAPLGLTNSYLGLVLAHATLATPFVVIVVHATLQGFDGSLLRAGASLGAPPILVIRKVLVPIIAPGIFAAAVFAFTTSFDEVVVAMFLAGSAEKTLPLKMFEGARDQISPAIIAAATILALVSITLLGALELIRRRRAPLQPLSASTDRAGYR
jgi:putative spermidine/putrescine transport system permease protein